MEVKRKTMDEDRDSRYRASGLTEEELAQTKEQAQSEVRGLTDAELSSYIRRGQREIDILCLKLYGTATFIVHRLHGLIQDVQSVAARLAVLETPWAGVHGKELLQAVQHAQISRHDREGKILLALPNDGDQTDYGDWLHSVQLVDNNSDWLAAACRYGLARLQALTSVAGEVAAALSAIDHPEAQASATELRSLPPNGGRIREKTS
jgi:hypothetical protein